MLEKNGPDVYFSFSGKEGGVSCCHYKLSIVLNPHSVGHCLSHRLVWRDFRMFHRRIIFSHTLTAFSRTAERILLTKGINYLPKVRTG